MGEAATRFQQETMAGEDWKGFDHWQWALETGRLSSPDGLTLLHFCHASGESYQAALAEVFGIIRNRVADAQAKWWIGVPTRMF